MINHDKATGRPGKLGELRDNYQSQQHYPLKRQSRQQQTTTSFKIFENNKEWYFVRIQLTILLKYHALFVIFEKVVKF